ncbi:IclR family transcriptional regulator [Photobacterium halotolerans]|uniref:IclR family transcriptional regulator n=1 Tax=Photobacterium halotolerans TaxID=265726 RepID=UPI0003FC1023|nr:IclR family transcriptional regulator [Photobacterium halotolerans]NAW87770.1 helix-turn-helix domain-containing protein [Photobacterium halotolerans]NAX49413.1 helix-turn-helix domain-containing protein [Photobacterium halotolerans]
MENKANAVSRIVEIITQSARQEQPVPLPELIFHSEIPKPTYHRLVQQLDDEQFLTADERGNVYPGAELKRIALNLNSNNERKAQLQAILHGLSRRVKETCGIAIPDGNEMVYHERIQTNWPLQIVLPIGMKTPVWATASGKLFLSSLTKTQRERIIGQLDMTKLAKNTHTDPDTLEQELKIIRGRQVSVDNEEFIDGLVAVAIPVKSADGKFLASLFCHCPKTRKSLDQLLTYLPDLERTRDQLQGYIRELT